MFRQVIRPIRQQPHAYYRASARRASTMVGASSRHYIQGETLHKNATGKPTVFKASRGNEPVVFKQESQSVFDLSRRLADEFAGSRRLRLPIDFSPADRIVVYPYFRDTLLGLVRADPEFPRAELKKVLRHVGEAIREFHAKGWLHLDIKPDNIFVDWAQDHAGNKVVTDAALGDFGMAYRRQQGGPPLRTAHPLGNFMWRSPEGQTASGVTKASDMFSYGLVCIYALGGGNLLLLEDEKQLAELAAVGIAPHEDILTRHFTYFGPANEGLLKQVDGGHAHNMLLKTSAVAERAVDDQPELRFEVWGEELGDAAVAMIAGLTRPDPEGRLTVEEMLESPWWREP